MALRSNSFSACGLCSPGSDVIWLFGALAALIALNYMMENTFWK